MVGKTTGTVGNSTIQVPVGLLERSLHLKNALEKGYIHETDDTRDIQDIFQSQSQRYPYFFTPVFSETSEAVEKKEIEALDGKTLIELKEICRGLGIEVLPQDKERSLSRMINAYKLGSGQ